MIKSKKLNFRILGITLLAMSSLILTQCKKDPELVVPEPPVSPIGKMPEDVKLAATGIISTSYYLYKSLPSGYVKDGSKDYTSYVQAAITKYPNVVFPAFPILVNYNGINIPSNRVITFQSGSEIRLKANSASNYTIFKIKNASNVTLYNPVIKGDRFTHTGTSGEWGMGIGIYGSSNVKVYNANITNCWGDGIYIGQYNSTINSKSILIKDSYLKSNRRDGITIIGVDGLVLDNLYSGYNNGTSPYCGINFEPNNSYCELKNIKINNSRTERNKNGIQLGTQHLVKNSNKYVDITITNHRDTRSPRFPIKIAGNVSSSYSGKLYGLINIVNPTFNSTAYETNQYIWLNSNQSNFKTSVSSPAIITSTGVTLSWSSTYTLLMKAAVGGIIKVVQY
jgi:hypothetical protein